MITFNTQHSIDELNLDKALHKLMAAHVALGIPLVITDTWFLDDKPLPHQLVANAIWRYEKQHAGSHPNVDFSVSSSPAMDTLLSHLTQLCNAAGEFATPRYSLKGVFQDHPTELPTPFQDYIKEAALHPAHICEPGAGRQKTAFDVMEAAHKAVWGHGDRAAGLTAVQAAMLKQYQSYFDIGTWKWVYNTVRLSD